MFRVSILRVAPFALLSASLFTGCQNPNELSTDRATTPATTPGACSGPSCAVPCTLDTECGTGQHCKAGACGADCTPTGGECGAGTCGADGRCAMPMPTATMPPEPEGSLIDDMGVVEMLEDAGACIEVVTGFDTVTPTVLLLIDRSLSMDDPMPVFEDEDGGAPGPGQGPPGQGGPGGPGDDEGPSRWDTVRDILTDPDTGLLVRLQADVRFGLSLYSAEQEDDGPGMGQGGFMFQQQQLPPVGSAGAASAPPMMTAPAGTVPAPSASGGAPGAVPTTPPAMEPMDMGPTCPSLVNVPIALNNYAAIDAVYAMTEPLYTTPTSQSVVAATQTLVDVTEVGPKILILATDGEPGDCIYPVDIDEIGSDANRAASVAAVEAAFTAGIETYVISVGDIGRDHLDDLAAAGSDDPDAAPYLPSGAAALEQAFLDIIGKAQGCSFQLEGEVPPNHAADGTVTLNGQTLVYGDANGWQMPDPSTVEVLGSACDLIETGSGEVNISFPCIPVREIMR